MLPLEWPQILLIYVIKVIRCVYLVLTLSIASAVMQNKYLQRVYVDQDVTKTGKKQLPSLANRLTLTLLCVDLSMFAVLCALLVTARMQYSTSKNAAGTFIVDRDFFWALLVDYFATLTLNVGITYALAFAVQSSQSLRDFYAYDGLRGIRSVAEVSLPPLVVVSTLLPAYALVTGF